MHCIEVAGAKNVSNNNDNVMYMYRHLIHIIILNLTPSAYVPFRLIEL